MSMATVTAFSSNNKIIVNIPAHIIRAEEIEKGDLIDLIIKNTHIKGKRRDYAFKKKGSVEKTANTTKPSPQPTPIKTDTIDPGIKAQILGRLKKDPAAMIISQVIGETDYEEADLLRDPEIAKAIDRQK